MKKRLLILIIISILGILFAFNYTKALYASNSIWNYYLNSKGFYLESNFLGNDKENIYNLWNGKDISFNIKNNNGDKYNATDTFYEVECISPSGITCTVSYDGILAGGSKLEDTITISVTMNESIIDADIKIILKSTKPYKKTLTGIFKLHKVTSEMGSFKYEVVNYNNYSLLNVSNYYSSSKCLNIRWADNNIRVLSDDISNIATDSNGYINEFDVSLNGNDTISIKFYNVGEGTINKNIFNVTECLLAS